MDDVLFTPNINALLISYDLESSQDIFDNKIDFAWKNLPESLKKLYQLDADTRRTLKFGFGDESFSNIMVRSSGRSGTFNRVHISELAKICKKFPQKAREIITGTIPAVPLDGRVDIESTAEGETGDFHDMWWEAWDRGEPQHPNQYKAHFYNWQWDDDEIAKAPEDIPISHEIREYQKQHNERVKINSDLVYMTNRMTAYYQMKYESQNKDWNKFMQEYPTTPEEAFISSGNKLFDTTKVKDQDKYIRKGEKVGHWIYYEKPNPRHYYGSGSDVAEGVGQDSSTIAIVDFTPIKPRLVAEYANKNIEPDAFAYEIRTGCMKYNNAIAGVERNNHGHTTIATLKGIYDNIYSEVKKDKREDKTTEKLGWHTNRATKPKMMYELSAAINEDLLEIVSRIILKEVRSYPKEDLNVVNFDPEQTKHWDRVIALAIAWQMKEHIIIPDYGDKVITSKKTNYN